MLARHCGLRGQTIVKVNRKQIVDHDLTGKAMRYYARKNKKIVTLPMMQELQDFLAELKVQRADGILAARPGTRWPCRKGNDAARPPGIQRRMVAANGATVAEVTDLIGDLSERMGRHNTRHVESEININRAFKRVQDKT